MDYKTLQADINENIRKPVYLLYGEERYLVRHYAEALAADCDRDTFDGDTPPVHIIAAAESLPFLAEKRAVLVRDSKLFVSGRKNDAEVLAKYILTIPPETVVIFTEADADKRLKIYKAVAETGRVIHCTHLPPAELNRWVIKQCRARNKTIPPAAVEKLLRATAHDMTALTHEIAKLAAHAGTRPNITVEDIDALTTPTLQTRVFDLLAAMGRNQLAAALTLYRQMLQMKESPHGILSMVIRHFRLILQCKCAQQKKMPKGDIAKSLGIHPYAATEALAQVPRYTTERLLYALQDCLDTDVRLKSGRLDAEIGVELLIVKYSGATPHEA